MIVKGNTHNSGGRLARYMTTAGPGERATLHELRGFAEDNIVDAFRSIHIIAAATQCEKPFFHVQVRNREGEELSREQWMKVADRVESKLGYSDQPRAIAFHRDEKTGHEHMHIAFSRIDTDTMTAKPLPFFKLRLKEVAREMEIEFGLTPVRNERKTKVMAPTRDEDQQARRLGVDGGNIRQTIYDCREQADSGRAFIAGLADQGLTLALGDQRNFVVVDQAGGFHALGKRILGISAAELRVFMADVELQSLPTVDRVLERIAQPTHTRIDRDTPLAEAVAAVEITQRRLAENEAQAARPKSAVQPATEQKIAQEPQAEPARATAPPTTLDIASRALGHTAQRIAGAGQTAARGFGGLIGSAIRVLEAPLGFLVDFFTSTSPAQPYATAHHDAPARENTVSDNHRHQLRTAEPSQATNLNIRELARSNPVNVSPELEAAFRRAREAEERARRERER